MHHIFYNKKTTHLIMIIFQEYASNGKCFYFQQNQDVGLCLNRPNICLPSKIIRMVQY